MILRWIPVAAISLIANLAWAAEEAQHQAEHAEHAAHGGNLLGHLGLPALNFLMFCAVMARYVAPAVRNWLRERHDRIVKDLEAAASAKAEALRLRDEWQARMSELTTLTEQMRTQAREDAERERQRILAAAQKSAETIRRDAERTAAYQARRMEEILRAELAKQALQQAEDRIRGKWTTEDQMRFVADFLSQVQA